MSEVTDEVVLTVSNRSFPTKTGGVESMRAEEACFRRITCSWTNEKVDVGNGG